MKYHQHVIFTAVIFLDNPLIHGIAFIYVFISVSIEWALTELLNKLGSEEQMIISIR